jgi:hypothetical protein
LPIWWRGGGIHPPCFSELVENTGFISLGMRKMTKEWERDNENKGLSESTLNKKAQEEGKSGLLFRESYERPSLNSGRVKGVIENEGANRASFLR